MSKKLILIIGAPGSGKSTDSKMISEKHKGDITTISVGDLLREEIKNETGVGKIAAKYVEKGDLVPGQVIMYEIFGLISNAPTNIVLLDGFPRGLNQMKEMGDALFVDKDIELVSVIEIRVSETTSRKRVLGDNPSKEEEALFEHKMEIYTALIGEIENYYKKDNLLTVIDGEQDVEAVASDIDEFLSKKVALFA